MLFRVKTTICEVTILINLLFPLSYSNTVKPFGCSKIKQAAQGFREEYWEAEEVCECSLMGMMKWIMLWIIKWQNRKTQEVLAFTIFWDQFQCSWTVRNLGTRRPPREEGTDGQCEIIAKSVYLSMYLYLSFYHLSIYLSIHLSVYLCS